MLFVQQRRITHSQKKSDLYVVAGVPIIDLRAAARLAEFRKLYHTQPSIDLVSQFSSNLVH